MSTPQNPQGGPAGGLPGPQVWAPGAGQPAMPHQPGVAGVGQAGGPASAPYAGAPSAAPTSPALTYAGAPAPAPAPAPVGPPPVQDPRTHLPLIPRAYHEFWASRRSPGWLVAWIVLGILASLAAIGVYLVAGVLFVVAAAAVTGQVSDGSTTTPALFIANNVALALLVPSAMLMGWALSRQRPRWLTSVEGGMRWRWFWRVLAAFAPIWLLTLGVLDLIDAVQDPGQFHASSATLPLLATVLLITPLQAAGEEYFFRGLVTRVVGSWFPSRAAGLIIAALVSAGFFTLMHSAADPWLNAFYFLFALAASYMTWRTGGLEAAIAMHVLNNVIAELTLPWTDISGLFNREVGTGSPWGLFQVGLCVLAIAAVELMLRRGKVRPLQFHAPGALTAGVPGQPPILRAGSAVPEGYAAAPQGQVPAWPAAQQAMAPQAPMDGGSTTPEQPRFGAQEPSSPQPRQQRP